MYAHKPFAHFDPAAFNVNVTCADGLESSLITEMRSFGFDAKFLRTGRISLTVSLAQFYHICLYSRVASRVHLPLGVYHFKKVQDADGKSKISEDVAQSLYEFASRFDWTDVFELTHRFVVRLSVDKRVAVNQQFATLRIKDAIADCFNAKRHARPSVDSRAPDVTISVQVGTDFAEFALDLTATSLHRRGYRIANTEAPLKENLAAALLYECGWHLGNFDTLVDPMCGSGTFVTEALLMRAGYPVGLEKALDGFGFYTWKYHDDVLWQRLILKAQDGFHERLHHMAYAMPTVIATDASVAAIRACHKNILASALVSIADRIDLQARPLAALHKSLCALAADAKVLVITNPPYGERLGDENYIRALYQGLGLKVQQGLAHLHTPATLAVIGAKVEDVDVLPVMHPKTMRCHNGALTVYFRHGVLNQQSVPSLIELFEKKSIILEGAQDFVNRLQKNLVHLKKQALRAQVTNLRIYDADLPDFNLAVDLYGTKVHVQEYAPPKHMDAETTKRRFSLALSAIRQVLGVNRQDIFIKTRARQSSGEQYTRQGNQGKFSLVKEDDVYFYVNFTDYLDTGLFIDHRNMRLRVKQASHGKRVLNLFAYTCSASVHAAVNAARSVTSVDLSANYLAWGRLNFVLNGLVMDERYAFIAVDVFEWIKQHTEQYDVIFIDPPTFSNSKKFKGTFDVQRDHAALINRAMNRLAADGVLYFSNNYTRFVLDAALMQRYDIKIITHETIGFDFNKQKPIHQSFEIRHKDATNTALGRNKKTHHSFNEQTQSNQENKRGKKKSVAQLQKKSAPANISARHPNKALEEHDGFYTHHHRLQHNKADTKGVGAKRIYINPKLSDGDQLAARLSDKLSQTDVSLVADKKRYKVKKKS